MDKPLARLTKKRREKKPKVQKSEMKKEKAQWILQKKKKKKHERILTTIMCQQIQPPGRNGQLPRDVQPTKTESRRNRSTEQTNR